MFDKNEHAIYYASRITTKYEKCLNAYELECLAILFALKVFKYYLINERFYIYTDNTAVTYMMKNKDTSNKLLRWSMKLQEFNF